MAEGEAVGLAAFLEGLRQELKQSITNAERDPALAFELTKLDVELQVTAESSREGNGKIKFWVVEVGAGAKGGERTVQTIKMSLQPLIDGKPTNPHVSTGTITLPNE